jgi:hypothetical protein
LKILPVTRFNFGTENAYRKPPVILNYYVSNFKEAKKLIVVKGSEKLLKNLENH